MGRGRGSKNLLMVADGQSRASHKRKMTLLECPQGQSFFYYKDIKPEIVHTLLLEEYGVSKKWVIIMDRRQNSNTTPAEIDSSRNKWIFTVPGV